MHLITFEAMLRARLEASGQVDAVRTFQEAAAPFWYGLFVQVDGGTVAFRFTKGSGTGDPAMTEAEQVAHDANVTRAIEGGMPRLQFTPAHVAKVEQAIRDVLVADLPPTAVAVEGKADGRELAGVKIRFDTGAEIYMVPIER